jgi:hypothetical protein
MLMATALSPAPAPAPNEVEAISNLTDPVLRNLRITECYHRLSTAFTVRTGQCSNWCTFATWASRQAGYTIRGEDMLAKADAILRADSVLLHPIKTFWRALIRRGLFYPQTRLGGIINRIHTPFDVLERASDAVGRGNRKVFTEIAHVFALYLNQCPTQAAVESEQFARFAAGLRQGDPPEGQDLLRRAFALYQQQAFETDPVLRAQMVYLANVLIGLHEQTRLQPEIREAMEAAPETARSLSMLVRLAWPLRRYSRELTCRIVTECLMVLRLPQDLTLELGRHLDRRPDERLRTCILPGLQEVVDRYSATDCSADNWSDLNQRMRYIANLFRCFHSDPTLLEAPFSSRQTLTILSGRVPRGEL